MITRRRSHRARWGAHISARALALALGLGLTGGFIPMLVSAPSASASNYCSLGATLTKDESGLLNQTSASATSSNFAAAEKTAFQNLFNYEPQIVSAAPSQLQAPFKSTFTVLRELYGQLSNVAFNPLKLTSNAQKALITEAKQLATDAQPINQYDKSVCHLKA